MEDDDNFETFKVEFVSLIFSSALELKILKFTPNKSELCTHTHTNTETYLLTSHSNSSIQMGKD